MRPLDSLRLTGNECCVVVQRISVFSLDWLNVDIHTNMLTRWEPGSSQHSRHDDRLESRRGDNNNSNAGHVVPSNRHLRTNSNPHTSPFGGFQSPVQCTGNVVYRSSTSRVYSLHGNCAEERRAEQDIRTNTEKLAVTRVLGTRSTSYTQHRNMTSGAVDIQRTAVNVPDEDNHQFDDEWMRAAQRHFHAHSSREEGQARRRLL